MKRCVLIGRNIYLFLCVQRTSHGVVKTSPFHWDNPEIWSLRSEEVIFSVLVPEE